MKNLSVLEEFHKIYFGHSTPSVNSSKISHFLFIKDDVPFKPSNPICDAPILLGVWLSTGAWLTYQRVLSSKRADFPICPSLFRLLTAPPLKTEPHSRFPFHTAISSGLSLCGSWTYCHNCYDFIWATALLGPENTVTMQSSATSGSSNMAVPWSATIHEPCKERIWYKGPS